MRVSIVASAALFCANALAAPIEGRDKGWSVYLSTDWEWGNRETTGLFQAFPIRGLENCVDLKWTPWDKTISSFGPDKSIKCIAYDGYNCQGNSFPIWYSGYARLGNLGWDDRISSYACGYCTAGVDEGCRDS